MNRRPKYLLDAIKERNRQIDRLDGTRELYDGMEADPAIRAIINQRYTALEAACNAVDRALARYNRESQEA